MSSLAAAATTICLVGLRKGLAGLVEYNEKKISEVKLEETKSALTTQITEETDISEVIETVKQHVKDAKLPDIEIVHILLDVIMNPVQWSGKNQQQNANAALHQGSRSSRMNRDQHVPHLTPP
ncbi:hypothetical protein AQUCO_01800112v1 [Aquilegia coerulea]|uniref:Uncharacterized protein n=1 Tax=Aquilegia coerulea TaxID=218851 RepID=A0A2G5DK22_AQUCA|nr:hypothetical protein AQUCO_01800112v1 [Aquilegia coerulea]